MCMSRHLARDGVQEEWVGLGAWQVVRIDFKDEIQFMRRRIVTSGFEKISIFGFTHIEWIEL